MQGYLAIALAIDRAFRSFVFYFHPCLGRHVGTERQTPRSALTSVIQTRRSALTGLHPSSLIPHPSSLIPPLVRMSEPCY
jgi:hypothetical protein